MAEAFADYHALGVTTFLIRGFDPLEDAAEYGRTLLPGHPAPAGTADGGGVGATMTDWKENGVRVIPGDSLDTNTPQTPGMNRAAAINFARVGAQKIWAGTVHIHPDAKTGAHHHGALESVIYVVARAAPGCAGATRWSSWPRPGPGDFIFVPPYVPHQEINASTDETLECVLVRSDNEAVVVNLDIEPVEQPEHGPLGRPDPQAPMKSAFLTRSGGRLTPTACATVLTATRPLRSGARPRTPSDSPDRAIKTLWDSGDRGHFARQSAAQ